MRGQDVAVKLLKSTTPIDVARFEREAKVLASLSHPGIVRYIAHGHEQSADGPQVWLAMEWLDGEVLSHRLARGVSLREALATIREAAEALSVAHARGVVHRDLKPANIFLTKSGQVKVLDFGIARALDGSAGPTLTNTGTAIGTPHFMSPEQARGSREVGPSTDVYALGVVLYQSICGVRPFEGDSPIAVLAKILLEDAAPMSLHVPNVPPEVDQLVARMLSKVASDRPGNGEILAKALLALGELEDHLVRRPSLPPTLGGTEQRLICVVMVAEVGIHGASGPTLLSTDELSTDLPSELRELARAHGGQVEFLADGSMVATVAGRGVATDLADRAARLSLSIREVLPEAPIALVAGRAVVTARLPAGDVIDRGVEALETPTHVSHGRKPVRIDDLVDGLLDDRFQRDGEAGNRCLVHVHPVELPRRTLLGVPVPCVGRRRELANLEALYEECVEEPVARAVLVVAPPGGGKTRIVQELLDRVGGRVHAFAGPSRRPCERARLTPLWPEPCGPPLASSKASP